MFKDQKIGFIGGGNMAEAIIKGLLATSLSAENITVFEPNASRRTYLQDTFGIALASNNLQLVADCDITILAIKPQIVAAVLQEMVAGYNDSKLIISILAGVTTTTIEQLLASNPRVVRVMPNTPALIGEGASAICRGQHASLEDLLLVQQLFQAVSKVELVEEWQMDAVTGLSGSGPAYVYTVIEALADGGVREGLQRKVAHELAVQTVIGAAMLVRETKEHPAVLRDQVCSPGGTTIAGVSSLETNGLRNALIEAVSAAAARSRELGSN